MQQKIQAQAKGEMDKTQREYFLREQLKAIQKELGELDETGEEVAEFRKASKTAKMPEKVLKETEKQLKRLEKMHPDTAESATVRTYLEWMVELPWNKNRQDNLDLEGRRRFWTKTITIWKNQGTHSRISGRPQAEDEMKGPILCFVGPRGWARPRWVNPSRALWAASSCASAWAACMTKPRSAATGAPMSAPCRDGSSRA